MKKILPALLTLFLILPTLCAGANAAQPPVEVKAKAYVLMDADSGKVLLEHNSRKKLYPASVTKIMPILLVMRALERGEISLSDKVTASAEAAAKGGSQIWLKEGEQMTVDMLLRAAVIASANDACAALGELIAGSEQGIVEKMNDTASQLGMKDTHFVNCTGLDDDTDEHLTTAYDVALMSRELLKHELILKYSTVWMDSLRDGATELVNTNRLVRFYKGTTGLKTGTTQKAGHCISASAERDSMHLIAVVMGSESSADRFDGAKALLDYGFSTYTAAEIQAPPEAFERVRVLKGVEDYITPQLQKLEPIILKKEEKSRLEVTAEIAQDVQAPVEKGQTLGTVSVSVDGRQIASYPLLCAAFVRRMSVWDMLLRCLSSLTAAPTE